MESHKSEVAVTYLLFAPTRKQCRLSPEMDKFKFEIVFSYVCVFTY